MLLLFRCLMRGRTLTGVEVAVEEFEGPRHARDGACGSRVVFHWSRAMSSYEYFRSGVTRERELSSVVTPSGALCPCYAGAPLSATRDST